MCGRHAQVMGVRSLDGFVEKIQAQGRHGKMLKGVYAEVHGKAVDDPDLKMFFKHK